MSDWHSRDSGRFADWRLAMKSILGFWLVYAATVVARAFLGTDPLTTLRNKAIIVAAGILLTVAVYLAINFFARNSNIRRKAVAAALASLAAAAAQAGILLFSERFMHESKEEFRYQAREGFIIVEKGNTVRIERKADDPLVLTWPQMYELDPFKQLRYGADTAVIWFFFFAAWSAFYLAALSQAQALRAQRRAAEAERSAQTAQVRALRYQVNPHFLFNTFNSLSSLIMTGKPDKAESMLLALSTFYRSSLSLDPTADVTLAEEINMQRLYLDIEKVRFPKRLKVEINVPAELENVRLPALLLQPIVENAIKYGVSASRGTVLLSIVAMPLGTGRMRLDIANHPVSDSRPASGSENNVHEGTGVGLANVCQRLTARFGARASCSYGPTKDGGYAVSITLPVDADD
ncbi:MAG TPA: histidine kinase [Sphingomicrobium sp.]|nr:histidine kinase [Sphingomicrobium sp.]